MSFTAWAVKLSAQSAANSRAMAAPSRALLRTSAMLAVRLAPSVISTIRPRRYGVASLPWMPSGVHVGEGLVDDRADLVGGDLVLDRDRVGDDQRRRRGRGPTWRAITAATSAGASTRIGAREAAAARVERRELVGAVAEHRHPERLERLQGQADVEDALHPGADHGDVGASTSSVRSALTSKRLLGAAVHAAEPAGHEDPDPGQRREPHRGGDGGGAVAAAGDDVRQVADADLDDVAGGWPAARGRRRPGRSAGRPSSTAIVAGTAPCSRMMPSTSAAISTFCG